MNKLQKRRAVSPILAVVILLGITAVAGGLVFSVFSQTINTANESNAISVQDVNLVATNDHGSFSMTIKNAGTKPWKSVSINGIKEDTPALIFYRPIIWNAEGFETGSLDPVTPSNIIDLDPSSTNALKVIGIGNLISYSTDNPILFGASAFNFGLKLWPTPSNFCSQSYSKISFVDAEGDCGDGVQSYIGKRLDAPIEPGKTISPAAFILTKQLTNSTGGESIPHDTIDVGETVVISIIIENTDGSQAQKDISVRARG